MQIFPEQLLHFNNRSVTIAVTMTLKDFFTALPVKERIEFAARCGTTYQQLKNVAYGRPCGESLAINIERESAGQVRCETLRPDVDWGYLRGTERLAA
jgi:DNA-binding transcriptional regulator YdaS (Cro superfamily)